MTQPISTTPNTYDRFRPVLPVGHAPFVGDLLNIVTQLPGLGEWVPPRIDTKSAYDLLKLMEPIWRVNGDASFYEAYGGIAEAITKGVEPPHSVMGELSCAACLRAFGAESAIKLPRQKGTRTPDLATSWPPSEHLQVEIIRPGERAEHVAASSWIASLINELHAIGRPFDIRVVCLEPLTTNERSDLLRIAAAIGANERHNVPDRWQLESETPPHAPGVLWIDGFNHVPLPTWWPASRFALRIQFRMAVGLPTATVPNPRVFGVVGLPFDHYLNPVRSKADRPQTNGTEPYLIAVDTSELHDASRPFKAELPSWFKLWDHVSGVLGFDSRMGGDLEKFTYSATLFPNPHARLILPEKLRVIEYRGLAWEADLLLKI